MIRKSIALFCLVLTISGCATYATGSLFQQAPAPTEKKSILYVFHPKSTIVYTPLVKINDKPFVKLTQMGYSHAYLSPGIYRLAFKYGGGAGTFISEIEVKGDQPIFVKYFSTGFGKSLKEVPETEALHELKEYRYVEPIQIEFE